MTRSRMVAVVLALMLSGIPLASPEHVHEVDDRGHVEFVVHRHFETHPASFHHDNFGVDHPDAPVATIQQDYTSPARIRITTPPTVALAVISEPSAAIHVGAIEFVERLIHAPPRAPTLQRGPPSSRLL